MNPFNPILTSSPTTDLTPVLRYRDGLYACDLLAAAISHLDFFTWLDGHSHSTDAEICAQFGFAARPVDVLLTLCRANGFVRTSKAGENSVTELAREHLVRTSLFFLGAYYDSMKYRPVTLDFLKVLKSGKPANWASLDDQNDWDVPDVRSIMERSSTSLPKGGLLIIHEVFVDDDKTGSIPAAEYSALLMQVTQGKCYTPSEYAEILNELSFETGPYQDTLGNRGFMTAVKI